MRLAAVLTCLALAALRPTQLLAAEDLAHPGAEHRADDNGTDPTRVSRTVQVKFEHLALRDGFSIDTLRVWYTQPRGSGLSAIFKLPVTRVDVLGNNGAGLGDVSVQLGKVFGLTKEGGHVVQGEMIFDTATRPELGGNQNVFKATYIRAFFLQNGAIFAPSFLHNVGLWGQGDAPRINLTTVDVYYVPKMADPRNLVTFDPNFSYNWHRHDLFGSLAVTLGRNLGKSPFGGNQFVLVKPAAVFGNDRPNRWGVELTYKVIGF